MTKPSASAYSPSRSPPISYQQSYRSTTTTTTTTTTTSPHASSSSTRTKASTSSPHTSSQPPNRLYRRSTDTFHKHVYNLLAIPCSAHPYVAEHGLLRCAYPTCKRTECTVEQSQADTCIPEELVRDNNNGKDLLTFGRDGKSCRLCSNNFEHWCMQCSVRYCSGCFVEEAPAIDHSGASLEEGVCAYPDPRASKDRRKKKRRAEEEPKVWHWGSQSRMAVGDRGGLVD